MNCDETFNAGICYVTDAYKRVCEFNEELHADLEKYRAENARLRELLIDVSEEVPWSFMDTTKYYMPLRADKLRKLLCRMRELGVEVE